MFDSGISSIQSWSIHSNPSDACIYGVHGGFLNQTVANCADHTCVDWEQRLEGRIYVRLFGRFPIFKQLFICDELEKMTQPFCKTKTTHVLTQCCRFLQRNHMSSQILKLKFVWKLLKNGSLFREARFQNWFCPHRNGCLTFDSCCKREHFSASIDSSLYEKHASSICSRIEWQMRMLGRKIESAYSWLLWNASVHEKQPLQLSNINLIHEFFSFLDAFCVCFQHTNMGISTASM